MKKAILRTWPDKDRTPPEDELVEIEDDYDGDPYGDKVPFTVGSNQTIIEIDNQLPRKCSAGYILCPCCKQYHTFPAALRPQNVGIMGCNNCGCRWDEFRRV
jgi:hypothetical protein